jgi:hypothetical protein
MTIHVTPIPKLTEFATPDLTLTTANAAGTASTKTTIRSDASILTYDTTVPETLTVSQSAAAGDTATAARRNHTHGVGIGSHYVGAFCGWAGNGTIITGSYNVTSVAKSATGRYVVTIATDFGNAYWTPLCITEAGADVICSTHTPTAGAVTIEVLAGGSVQDTACRFAGIGTPA